MAEQLARLRTGIELCYESFGDPSDPTIVLVMGLGCPMNWWSPDFCGRLVDQGFRVVRFDNRDTGRSSQIPERVTRRQLVRGFIGAPTRAPYSMSDMAADAIGILDQLGVDRAHLVGASMGGMVAQTAAIDSPDRVLSLTSIMSTTGRRTVGWQHPRLLANLFGAAGHDRDAYVAHALRVARRIGSPGYPIDQQMVVDRAAESYDRGWTRSGVLRQLIAVVTQPDRTADLSRVTVPTCVIHGASDPLVH